MDMTGSHRKCAKELARMGCACELCHAELHRYKDKYEPISSR